jgi:hypothetical protein
MTPMQSKLLADTPAKTFALVLDTDDEIVRSLETFAHEHGLTAAHFQGLGACSRVELGFFDVERKDYTRIPIDEQVEVLALVGDVASKDGRPQIHPHIVVGKADGTAHGGHLMAGRVRPTLEIVVTESPAHLRRYSDAETGLALIRL